MSTTLTKHLNLGNCGIIVSEASANGSREALSKATYFRAARERKENHIGNKSTTPLCWHLATHSITEFILEEGEGKGIYVEYSGPLCQQQPGLPNTAAANVLSTQTKSSTKEALSSSPLLSHTDKALLGEKQKKPSR